MSTLLKLRVSELPPAVSGCLIAEPSDVASQNVVSSIAWQLTLEGMAKPTSYRPAGIPKEEASTVASRDAYRDDRQFRPMHMKVGVLNRAVGSAYIEACNTKIMCAVYGPRQVEKAKYSEKGRLKCDLRYTSVTSPELERHRRTTEEKDPSQQIHRALEVSVRLDKYPKSVIDVFIIVLDSDGAVLPLSITCAALALADAGIEMYDMVAACSVLKLGPRIIIDPTEQEEELAATQAAECDAQSNVGSLGGSLMVAYMPSLSLVTQMIQTGELEVDMLSTEMMGFCVDGCSQLHHKMRDCLVNDAMATSENGAC